MSGTVSYTKLGTMGNLGNQLFQIASSVGIARLNGMDVQLPEWQYEKYFKGPLPCFANEFKADFTAQEPHYHYAELTLDRSKNVDLVGWLQSEKYWKHCEAEIRELFSWDEIFLQAVKDRFTDIVCKDFVAVSVRRGDYVDNPNYYQLTADYYITLMRDHVGPAYTFVIFSDDFEWCKENIGKALPGFKIHYAEGLNAIEQLCLGSLADALIISNSSFAWWMAYLSNADTIMAPEYWNDGPLLQHSNDKDVKPDHWYEHDNPEEDNTPNLIDLSDVTFTIPVKIEHTDRYENLATNLLYLDEHFKTNVIIYEQDSESRFSAHSGLFMNLNVESHFQKITDSFERTRLLNDMAHMATTPIIVNWDTDVFIHPQQILDAVNLIRENRADGVYPYDGRFYRCSRNWERMLQNKMDVSIFKNVEWPEHQETVMSFGGAVIWNKHKFLEGGGENQYMIHYGPEDFERYERFTKLGYRIERIGGPLYHLDHYADENGSLGHAYTDTNVLEFQKVQRMSADQLRAYVSHWPWRKEPFGAPVEVEELPCALDALKLDKLWCLTLSHRKDRQKSAMRQYAKIGTSEFYFFLAVDGVKEGLTHPDILINPGMRGCFESHKRMLLDAIGKGYESILITEDDLIFIEDFNTIFKQCVDLLPEDWQFIYLGHYENDGGMEFKEQVNARWVIPNAVWGTHGYAVRGKETIRRLYEALTEQTYQVDIQICRFLKNSDIKHYATFPPVIFQDFKNLPTDIQIPFEQKLI